MNSIPLIARCDSSPTEQNYVKIARKQLSGENEFKNKLIQDLHENFFNNYALL